VSVERGAPWGRPASEPATHIVTGDDHDLAAWSGSGALVRFAPSHASEFARTLGLDAGATDGNGTEVAVDVMNVRLEEGAGEPAVNAVVVGTAPGSTRWFIRSRTVQVAVDGVEVFAGRATGVVIASGQYLHGGDVNPRSHPGDGRVEVQVYALAPGARASMRRRLVTGTHVPHPGVTQRAGRDVIVTARSPLPVEIDGVARARTREVTIHVEPGALRLLL